VILTGFSALDNLTGGLGEGKNYLLYGDVSTGKTTFSLQFLYQGLTNGETVGLVTRRIREDVFEQGLAFGMDLEPFARNEHMIIFEYTSRVIENAMRLKEHDEISREIMYLLGNEVVTRLVFDPITPLLASPSSSVSIFRARSLVQALSELQATSVYVFDTPEGEEYLGNFKDFTYGALRIEAGETTGTGQMHLERFPGLKGRALQLNFEITPGSGMVELPSAATATAPEPRRIVVIEPDRAAMEDFRALLGKEYTLLAADGAADGMAKVAAEHADLLILERDTGDLDGIEICRKLRQNRINLPILLISKETRRTRDKVDIMAAGADELLVKPIDGRILKLTVQNLLRRYEGVRDRYLAAPIDSSVNAGLERDTTTTTTNLAYFFDRVRQEVVYSTDNALSFVVLAMSLQPGSTDQNEMREVASKIIREYDLLYSDKERIAVLLAESDEKGASSYLRRFEEKWQHTPEPTVAFRCFARQPDFLQLARSLMDLNTDTKSLSKVTHV
jgi:DNA-binding response OmpR family regulator/archaellum biogenesis ATPase FlaH